jgi:signal transduction histidine kinase/CheY-like chemotaxis protein
MIKSNIKSTYPRILFLFLSSSVFFIILYFALYRYTKKAERQVYKSSTAQFITEVNKLLVLDSKPIALSINNDSNWDEFVDFIKSNDLNWYNDNVANELIIFNVDYLGVYDADGNFLIQTASSKIKPIDFIPKIAMAKLKTLGLNKFYLKIPEGIIEVFGASIHPSNDILKNKTESKGYFFVARIIDSSFLKNLENLTNSKIELVENNKKLDEQLRFIKSTIPLIGIDGKVVSKLHFKRYSPIYFDKLINILFLIIFAFVFNLIINLILTRKWVYYPLELVKRILETGNSVAIQQLKKSTGEFRQIGTLFEENSHQKMELIAAKIKAEESDRLKSAFLANLSHEIRTPMNAINGFTDLILNTKLSKEEKLDYLKVIQSSGTNLVSIIDDLIEMSKIESNQIKPNFSSINLDSCISELHETIKITIPKSKQIEFKVFKNTNPAEHLIKVDETKLKQVLVNLINNAIKFTEKGHVAFGYEVDKNNAKIIFRVQDTGMGIDEYNHQYIFDRFKRVESDLSIKVGGLGLGLAISKAYIDMMGGEISLESKVGKGSIFTFSIPLNYDKRIRIEVKSIKNKVIENVSEGATILIAEDDNINFLLIQKMIQSKNYNIIRALNGQEAVDICKKNIIIDLVLMDIKMPIKNGFEALEEIKLIRPNLKVIAQTAYSSNEDEEKIYTAGFYGYLTKPINRERLYEMIDEVFNNK